MRGSYDFGEVIQPFLVQLGRPFRLRAVFFDMDGVLFDSMPQHAEAWLSVFRKNNLDIPEAEPYLNEGSTALYTVRKMYRNYANREVSEAFANTIRAQKHEAMAALPEPPVFEGMPGLIGQIRKQGIDCWVVTGSAQEILLDRLEKAYSGLLKREKAVTGLEVHHGKPHPEPYLKALAKSGFQKHEIIVIENAPLGVESAKAAGLFTIAVNTGPLDPFVLKNAGADIVLPGVQALQENWGCIFTALTSEFRS